MVQLLHSDLRMISWPPAGQEFTGIAVQEGICCPRVLKRRSSGSLKTLSGNSPYEEPGRVSLACDRGGRSPAEQRFFAGIRALLSVQHRP